MGGGKSSGASETGGAGIGCVPETVGGTTLGVVAPVVQTKQPWGRRKGLRAAAASAACTTTGAVAASGWVSEKDSQLQLNALVCAAAHLFKRGTKSVDSADGLPLGKIPALGVGSLLLWGNAGQQSGSARQSAKHQVAVMAGKLHAQAAHIHALLAQLGYFFQRSDRIPGGNGITDFKQVSPCSDACHTAYKSFINLVVNTGAGVQNGQRITHGTISQTADELRGVLIELDFFPARPHTADVL